MENNPVDSASNVTPHIQIIHFVGGIKRTIKDVICVWENEMAHVVNMEGVEWIINKSNVLMVERIYHLDRETRERSMREIIKKQEAL